MAKMGKLTPEEEARNKMIMRERDRERKRIKRMNPEYRRLEQQRDRDRKKARRSNEAFRQMEKLRDKIRKDRKKGINVDSAALTAELVTQLQQVPVEPEVIISDSLTPSQLQEREQRITQETNSPTRLQESQQQQQHSHHHHHQHRNAVVAASVAAAAALVNRNTNRDNSNTINVTVPETTHNSNNINPAPTITTMATNAVALTNANSAGTALASSHLQQLNKGLLYPPHTFAHHPLPIPGVTLMPQLCHPMLHQNLSASLYQTNSIKQEYEPTLNRAALPATHSHNNNSSPTSSVNTSTSLINADEQDTMSLIEPEIILQTSPDVIAAPHHFQNHAHAHHLHQQQCNMFQHMSQQAAHMNHMRVHAHLQQPPPLPPIQHSPSTTAVEQQMQQLAAYAANKVS